MELLSRAVHFDSVQRSEVTEENPFMLARIDIHDVNALPIDTDDTSATTAPLADLGSNLDVHLAPRCSAAAPCRDGRIG